ncbi:hypothetical protein MalM25_34270 [Planctomycetes bacterium MalM25]|nr:hypothetical protein MalM25_34270 [Planctomycetes bacterium MalM25]
MANTMRWRYGDTNPVTLPVADGVAVEIGDLIYLNSGVGAPASAMPDEGSPTLNQQTFQDSFVGVAMQASPSDEETTIRIATSGVFEFDCDSVTWELGSPASTQIDGSGVQLYDQRVVSAPSLSAAIGRCAKQASVASTRVLIEVVSSVMRGGPQDRE